MQLRGNLLIRSLRGTQRITHNQTTTFLETAVSKQWFAMRDLKRVNARRPAYVELREAGLEVFTPLKRVLVNVRGAKVRKEIPYVPDLLFVHETRPALDPMVEQIPTLQYRYRRGYGLNCPTTVRETDMQKFIAAISTVENPRYYRPEEITPAMLKKRIRIVGGPLDGCEGNLLTVRGSKSKRLLVEIPGFIVAAVEVGPEYIQLL